MLKDKKFLILLGFLLILVVFNLCQLVANKQNDNFGARTSDDQWDNDGDDIYYTDGNAGFGTNTPNEGLTLSSSTLMVHELGYPENVTTATTTGGSLIATTTHYFLVSAVNGNGETKTVSEQTCVTSDVGESAIATKCNITWEAISLADSYNVWVSTSTGAFTRYFSTTTIPAQIATTTNASVGTLITETDAYINQIGANADNFFLGNKTGIGTATPRELLDIYSTATPTLHLSTSAVDKGGSIEMKNSAGTLSCFYIVGTTPTVVAGACSN